MARRKGQVWVRPLIDAGRMEPWFHPGQAKAWGAEKRFLLVLAGAQSGKSVCGARLLLREIQRTAKAGEMNDYLIVGPNTEILKKKAKPEFGSLVKDMADYRHQDRCFVFTPEGSRKLTGVVCDIKVFLGYATDPDSLEAATYKGIWADECGQRSFLRESWEALQRRAAVEVARIFMTTTPYAVVGWLKEIYDDAKEGRRDDTDIVQFISTDNPRFSQGEFDRIWKEYPPWRARQFLLGEFTRPSGAIYDCFDESCIVESVPHSGITHLGMDFGEVNTAALAVREYQDGSLIVCWEYHAGNRTVEEHVGHIRRQGPFEAAIGGTWTGEDPRWRTDFMSAGLDVARPTLKEVEPGINRVYRQFRLGRLKVSKKCPRLIRELQDYSREVDDGGEPTDKIADRHRYHLSDSLRVLVATLRPAGDEQGDVIERLKPGVKRQEPRDEDRQAFEANARILEEEAKEDKVKARVVMRRVL